MELNASCTCGKDSVIMLILSSCQVLIPPSDVKEKLQKDAYKPKEVPDTCLSSGSLYHGADFDFLIVLYPTTFSVNFNLVPKVFVPLD